jgi:hypothetical protein
VDVRFDYAFAPGYQGSASYLLGREVRGNLDGQPRDPAQGLPYAFRIRNGLVVVESLSSAGSALTITEGGNQAIARR